MNQKKAHSSSRPGVDAIRRLHHWLYVVHLQFGRIDRIIEEMRVMGFLAETADTILERMARLEADEHFMLEALNKLDRWLGKARRFDPALKSAAKAFRMAIPYLVEIRNMWEHDEEYWQGKGRKQSSYVRDEVLKGFPQTASATMMWTDPINGVRHVLGNRFDIQKAREAIKNLTPHVTAAVSRVAGAHQRSSAQPAMDRTGKGVLANIKAATGKTTLGST